MGVKSRSEAARLYQAALEDRRARRTEIGDGYQTSEERDELRRLDVEVERTNAELYKLWLTS